MFNDLISTNNGQSSIIKWGAISYVGMSLCYASMFIIFGVLLAFPNSGELADKIAYIANKQFILSLSYTIGYLVFGTLLLVSVQATHTKLSATSNHLLNLASAFGFIWVVLMMCSGMIGIIGLNTMVTLHTQQSDHATTLFYLYTTVVNGLGGGIELVGGMWVFLIGLCGLNTQQLSKSLSLMSIFVGLLGILTLIQSVPELKDAFGLSQIIWFVWMGSALHSKKTK